MCGSVCTSECVCVAECVCCCVCVCVRGVHACVAVSGAVCPLRGPNVTPVLQVHVSLADADCSPATSSGYESLSSPQEAGSPGSDSQGPASPDPEGPPRGPVPSNYSEWYTVAGQEVRGSGFM